MKVNVNEWFYQNKVNVTYPYVLASQQDGGYEIIKETEKAVQISVVVMLGDNSYDRLVWIPKSMCMTSDDYNHEQDLAALMLMGKDKNGHKFTKEEKTNMFNERKAIQAKRLAF